MAYLGTDDKQNQDPNQQQQSGSAAPGSGLVSGSGVTPLVGGSGGSVNASPSTAGPQGGGGTGWTNIQSYLTANQGNTGASDTLAKNVGNSFAQDKSNIASQSQDLQNQAQQAGQSNYMAPDQASQLLQQASSQYNPSAQNSDYQNAVGQFRNDLNGQWSGPQANYNPQLSANTTQYGQGLGNDDQLNAMMGNFYNQNGQSPLTTGQMDLQNLLQANDPSFQQTRQNLEQQYMGLQPYAQQQATNTNTAIQNAQTQYGANQQQLHDYLTGQSGQDQTALNNAADRWNNLYGSDPSSLAYGQSQSQLQQILNLAKQAAPNQLSVYDIWSADPTANPNVNGPTGFGSLETNPNYQPRDLSLTPYLNQGGVANVNNVPGMSDQRNQFNTIADILGKTPIGQSGANPAVETANYQKLLSDLAQGAQNTVNSLQGGGLQGWSPSMAQGLQNTLNNWQIQAQDLFPQFASQGQSLNQQAALNSPGKVLATPERRMPGPTLASPVGSQTPRNLTFQG